MYGPVPVPAVTLTVTIALRTALFTGSQLKGATEADASKARGSVITILFSCN
ncbi:hypothetical protein D3C86_1323860 [compost metagenome]